MARVVSSAVIRALDANTPLVGLFTVASSVVVREVTADVALAFARMSSVNFAFDALNVAWIVKICCALDSNSVAVTSRSSVIRATLRSASEVTLASSRVSCDAYANPGATCEVRITPAIADEFTDLPLMLALSFDATAVIFCWLSAVALSS